MVRRAPLPLGYHRIHLRVGELDLESHLFAAPYHAYRQPESNSRRWGVFCPLYAAHSERSWGAGDVSDLAELARFVGGMKGQAVATLPMLAAFLDEPFNPSPYAPVSRLFWNEFYLDVTKIPELAQCPAAQAMLDSGEFRRAIETVRAAISGRLPQSDGAQTPSDRSDARQFFTHVFRRAARAFENFVASATRSAKSTPPFAPKPSANERLGCIGLRQIAMAR